MRERLTWWTVGHGIVFFLGLTGLVVTTGYVEILVALLPAAYQLVLHPDEPESSPEMVVVAHFVAIVVGWMTYAVLAQGISATSVEPMSEPGLRIVGSALIAFVGSTAIFQTFDINHPMAYVTLFTAAIGLYPTVPAISTVAVGVLFIAGLQTLRRTMEPN